MISTTHTFENGTTITWYPGDDGGGSTNYIDFLNAIGKTKKYNKCLEWCAGLSAISFSLLDLELVNHCVLMDCYKPALDTAIINAAKNNLTDRVTIYCCDEVKKILDCEKFDLVVGNPPHVFFPKYLFLGDNPTEIEVDNVARLTFDLDFKIHNEFFSNITSYLNNGAELFISEVDIHSKIFQLADSAKLKFIKSYPAPSLASHAKILHFKYEEKIY